MAFEKEVAKFALETVTSALLDQAVDRAVKALEDAPEYVPVNLDEEIAKRQKRISEKKPSVAENDRFLAAAKENPAILGESPYAITNYFRRQNQSVANDEKVLADLIKERDKCLKLCDPIPCGDCNVDRSNAPAVANQTISDTPRPVAEP